MRATAAAVVIAGIGIPIVLSSFAATSTPAPSSGFHHPGILVSPAQLTAVQNRIATKASPWTENFARLSTAKATDGQIFTALTYTPHPAAVTNCDSNNADCVHLRDDGVAAYSQALAYNLNLDGQKLAHGAKAVEILNAWSRTATAIGSNQGRLEAAWAADEYPRAAELIRYTYTPATGTPALDVAATTHFFTTVLRPQIVAGDPYSNGNWELAMADGLVNIGVYTDDQATYNAGLSMWRQRVPGYVYEPADDNASGLPNRPPGGKYNVAANLRCYWLGAGTVTSACTVPANFHFQAGMVQETCRDLSHVTLGLEAMVNTAETARLQGTDLYGEQATRIRDAFEYSAHFGGSYLHTGQWPTSPCGGRPGSAVNTAGDGTGGIGYVLGWEIALNQFAGRLHLPMPETTAFIQDFVRPSSFKAAQHIAWETLTFAGESGSTAQPSSSPVAARLPVADINGDGKVSLLDLSLLLAAWNHPSTTADLDHSGNVDILDLSILLKAWTG